MYFQSYFNFLINSIDNLTFICYNYINDNINDKVEVIYHVKRTFEIYNR